LTDRASACSLCGVVSQQGPLLAARTRMHPRHWSGRQVALFLFVWLIALVILAIVLSSTWMAGFGPSGGLVGISVGLVPPFAAIILGPPVLVLLLWIVGRSGPKPPAG
jgi:hypothetical protein